MCDEGGVSLIMQAMDKHFEHAPTVAVTCGLLRQLAKSDSVKKLFVNIDGFKILTKALEAHKSSIKVCMQVSFSQQSSDSNEHACVCKSHCFVKARGSVSLTHC